MHQYVTILFGAVSDALDHRFHFSMQIFAVLAPEVSFGGVDNELHVLVVGLQNRVVRENAKLLPRVIVRLSVVAQGGKR